MPSLFVRRRVLALVLVLTLAPSMARPARSEADPEALPELPANIRVIPFLEPVVRTLLQRSPTFRAQCAAIGADRRVRVVVQAVWLREGAGGPRARATITRYTYGMLHAAVDLPLVADFYELLPHELEHVLEQMEGVDLAAAAAADGGQAAEVADGTFETERARRAGRRAAAEVLGEDPAVSGAARGIRRAFRAVGARARPGGTAPRVR